MCGIAGIVQPQENPRELIQRMTDSMAHRGPDSEGYVYFEEAGGIALGHRRLAILDLSDNGRQPLISRNGRYAIVYNGEIYNFEELKRNLPGDGTVDFRSGTDTEVLLEHFAHFGVETTLKVARGMFAIGLYDREAQTLTLMRDRGGEKPLYYGRLGKSIVFASELKAIRAIDSEHQLEIDSDAVKAFLKYGYIPQPMSIYRGIYKLTQGHYITIRCPSLEFGTETPYWQAGNICGELRLLSYPEAKEELKRLLHEVIKRQMVVDVPYGAFLSGGIDSSLVTAIMQENSSTPIDTFTIGFEDVEYNEADYARSIARALGCRHHERRFSARDLLDCVPRLSWVYDEPMADVSQLPILLLSRIAKERVTVCLTGDSGDELFLGYPYYARMRKLRRLFPKGVHRLAGGLMRMLSPADGRFYWLGKKVTALYEDTFWVNNRASFFHREIDNLRIDREPLLELKARVLPEGLDFMTRLKLWDFYTQMSGAILCKVDRAAMAYSLETRIPFLDTKIIELAMALPTGYEMSGGNQKRILKDILSDYLPRELFERPKRGFGVPIHCFLAGELREWAQSYVLGSELYAHFPFLNREALRTRWSAFLRDANASAGSEFWKVCILGQWLEADSGSAR